MKTLALSLLICCGPTSRYFRVSLCPKLLKYAQCACYQVSDCVIARVLSMYYSPYTCTVTHVYIHVCTSVHVFPGISQYFPIVKSNQWELCKTAEQRRFGVETGRNNYQKRPDNDQILLFLSTFSESNRKVGRNFSE